MLVEEFQNAHLECFVDSNPVNERVISWQRRRNETELPAVPPLSTAVSSSSSSFDDDDESVYNRMRSDVEILSEEAQQFTSGAKVKSSLLILNATLDDSGTSFDCIANNGIGKVIQSTLTLLVLRKFLAFVMQIFLHP